MTPVQLSYNAQADLRALKAAHPGLAAKLGAILSEMKANPELQDRLLQHGWRDERYHVEKWVKEARNNRDIWRIKVWNGARELEGYRIVYCLVPVSQHNRKPFYYVLAVTSRADFSYGERENDEISKRIVADFESVMAGDY